MYRIEFEARARKEFLELSKEIQHDLLSLIDLLCADPRPFGSKKLKGVGGYRIRKGDYRILYTISDEKQIVRIYRIRHRRDAYRLLN